MDSSCGHNTLSSQQWKDQTFEFFFVTKLCIQKSQSQLNPGKKLLIHAPSSYVKFREMQNKPSWIEEEKKEYSWYYGWMFAVTTAAYNSLFSDVCNQQRSLVDNRAWWKGFPAGSNPMKPLKRTCWHSRFCHLPITHFELLNCNRIILTYFLFLISLLKCEKKTWSFFFRAFLIISLGLH